MAKPAALRKPRLGKQIAGKPLVIGLTGAIGSGKSEASRIFRELGATIIDADQLAREAVAPGTPGLAQIQSTFGSNYISPDGSLNRAALGELVFADKAQLKKLEAILHPLIKNLFKTKLSQVLNSNPPPKLVIYDVPLLFESKLTYEDLHAIVVVSAPRQTCLDRITKRSSLTPEAAAKRFDSQLPLAQKEALADYVIHNDSSLDDLKARIRELYEILAAK